MRFLFCVLLYMYSAMSMSYDIQGRFENLGIEKEIKEGSSFKGYLRIWPFEDHSLEELKKEFSGKTFLSFFHVVNVTSIKYSENNSDVLEVYMDVILKKHFKNQSFYIWSFRSVNVPIELININTLPIKNNNQISILESEYRSNNKQSFFFIALIIFLVALIVVIILYRKKKTEPIDSKKDWNDLFFAAKDRSDFENIYMIKDEWLKEIGGVKPIVKDFFDTLNKVQYKKEWSEADLLSVRDSFIEIREIFKK